MLARLGCASAFRANALTWLNDDDLETALSAILSCTRLPLYEANEMLNAEHLQEFGSTIRLDQRPLTTLCMPRARLCLFRRALSWVKEEVQVLDI